MRRWIIADTHFGHGNIIKYEARPFENAAAMDETLVAKWNARVAADDVVYVLGDFTLCRRLDVIQHLLSLLRGRKVLVMGNHDTRKPAEYVQCGFTYVSRKPIMVDPGVILMHEPFQDSSLICPHYLYFFGHVHAKHCNMDDYANCMCVSVERTDYVPIDLDQAIKKLRR